MALRCLGRSNMATAILALAGPLLLGSANAEYKVDTKENIRESARTLAYDMMLYYHGNETGQVPGILPGPPDDGLGDYYWWEGGAMMGTYIDYWHLTGDKSYNNVVEQGMLHQATDEGIFMPRNFTASMGNDDQGFWGMSAMLAAENKFPNPPKGEHQWLALAQGVWNTMADPKRHDDKCGGGLRWQIFPANDGYSYKNTIANACFFNIGARLARYTGNDTYAKHAEETWDWIWDLKYIDHDNWYVYDGGHIDDNCTKIEKTTYSYNAAALIQGAAFLYNHTHEEKWKKRVDGLLDGIKKNFFAKGAVLEVCEPILGQCETDQLTFKGFVHRWLAQVTQLVPDTKDIILPMLKKSAEAAVKQCTGGDSGRACGFYWVRGKYFDPSIDGTSGAGEAMSVLAAVSSLLIEDADPPVTADKGGISKGNPNAGQDHDDIEPPKPITAGDKAGAAILTILVVGLSAALFVWMAVFD